MTRTPWHVRAARKYGQPAVLYAALALSAPGEYGLATMAGWSPRVAWLMPAVLSLYAAIGASVSKAQKEAARSAAGTTRETEAKRRATAATRGALMALFLATAAQVTDHLLTADVVGARVWVLVAVSSVPPLVAAHVLHIDPPIEEEVAEEPRQEGAQEPQEPVSRPLTVVPDVEPVEDAPAPLKPFLVSYADAADDLGVAVETVRGWAAVGKIAKHAGPTPSTVRVDLVECHNVKNGRAAAGR